MNIYRRCSGHARWSALIILSMMVVGSAFCSAPTRPFTIRDKDFTRMSDGELRPSGIGFHNCQPRDRG